MAPGSEANGRPEVIRSLARAFQDRLISPPALKLAEQEARVNLLQERLDGLEDAASHLRLMQKKTETKVLIVQGMLAAATVALIYLLAHFF